MNARYPGGKNGYGVYQKLINLMPPHKTYIETHLGGGAILRRKRPASKNIAIEIDPDVMKQWERIKKDFPNTIWHQGDAHQFLRDYSFDKDELVYSDPPYDPKTRKTGRNLYKFEYTRKQHIELLDIITQLECMVMISGYDSKLYNDALASWNKITFKAQTSSGIPGIECVWFNYEEPVLLHDYSYLGDDYRERERIKKKAKRWVERFQKLPVLERQAIIGQLKENKIL